MKKHHLVVWLASAILATFLSTPVLAGDKLPPTIVVGTQQTGSMIHSMATGIAKVATDDIGVPVIVRPHSGASTALPLLNKGELDLCVASNVDLGMSYQGPQRVKVGGINPYTYAPRLRLVMVGSPLLAGLVVKKDSPIKSALDLKGKRVAGRFSSGVGGYINMFVHLAGANLTWEDVKVIPYANLNDSLNGLILGRCDVTVYGVGAPQIRDANARVGVRFINDDCSPEGTARILAAAPGYFTVNLKAGFLPAVEDDICVTAFAVSLIASDKTPDNIVTAVVKAVWKDAEKLQALHPGLRNWKRETGVTKRPTAPYHRAAIAFYESVGAWNADVEAAHQKVLSLTSK